MIPGAVARYAARFHRLLGGAHGVASPFGAWLLLALVAPSSAGDTRRRLADVLGCEVDDAFAAAARMLNSPHAELVLGAAVWHDPQFETESLLDLLRRLAAHVEAGPIPSQAEADAWAKDRTLGLIERFPLDLEGGDPVVLLLATAIAARVSWELPFVLAPPTSTVLPAAPGFAGLAVLRDPGGSDWAGFVETPVGVLAAYTARSANGLLVTSGVGAPQADPAAVLDATQQVACAVAAHRPPPALRLLDLPLGDGPAWRVTEQWAGYVGVPERYEFVLPAWAATSDHELMSADLGFVEAGGALVELLPPVQPPDRYEVEARQSALARYSREGFEAAAVTALGVRLASAMPRSDEGPVRTARVEFTQPHAVVAATEGEGEWDGLPVFSVWVAQAVPAE